MCCVRRLVLPDVGSKGRRMGMRTAGDGRKRLAAREGDELRMT